VADRGSWKPEPEPEREQRSTIKERVLNFAKNFVGQAENDDEDKDD
jgi:hypothetical protein